MRSFAPSTPSCCRTLAVTVCPAPWPQGQGLALLLFFFYQPRSPFSVPTLHPDGIPSARCQSQFFLTCSYNLLHPFLPHHSQSSLPSRPAKDAARTKSERSPPPAPSITPSHHQPFSVLTASPPRDAAPQSTLLASIRLLQPYLTLMTLLDPNLPFYSPPLLSNLHLSSTLNSSLSTLHFSHPAPSIATSRNVHPDNHTTLTLPVVPGTLAHPNLLFPSYCGNTTILPNRYRRVVPISPLSGNAIFGVP